MHCWAKAHACKPVLELLYMPALVRVNHTQRSNNLPVIVALNWSRQSFIKRADDDEDDDDNQGAMEFTLK